ncbi:MAG TPA: hypothetical protein DDW41_00760 [Candidatus Andersenbacteria bacterium]|nr:MAG: hypothetical protein UW94_C0012G0017 [Parcubacteria group bacterium GW2011_GWA2_45_14]OGY34425.1 MAG: hypothetical protein A3B76_03890 [Candidatus Andersenbacteria bacterium RIFCSPHIGHO2_02_FULL_46_16]HBE89724.1 hypothetical protein [Candidatus Andersenbacteria bacterium]
MSSKHSWLIIMCSLGLFVLALIDNNPAQLSLMTALSATILFFDSKGRHILGWAFVLIICVFSQWGIGQFILQQDLGLRLIGESILGSSINGVAKFGNGIVRGYGPFEHANIFGGICLLALIVVEPLLTYSRNTLIRNVIIFTLGLGVFVSFSRAAILGWFVLALVVGILYRGRRHARTMGIIILLFMIVLWPLLLQRLNDSRDVAVSERIRGYLWSAEIMKTHSAWYGLGLYNYKMELRNYLNDQAISYHPWEIDYVHSVPLMVMAQTGMLSGGMLIIAILFWLVKILPGRAVIMMGSLLPVLSLDHFYITQPVALMYLTLAVIILRSKKTNQIKCV